MRKAPVHCDTCGWNSNPMNPRLHSMILGRHMTTRHSYKIDRLKRSAKKKPRGKPGRKAVAKLPSPPQVFVHCPCCGFVVTTQDLRRVTAHRVGGQLVAEAKEVMENA